jgi:hypothetical protein
MVLMKSSSFQTKQQCASTRWPEGDQTWRPTASLPNAPIEQAFYTQVAPENIGQPPKHHERVVAPGAPQPCKPFQE